jgi:hypothetical protein
MKTKEIPGSDWPAFFDTFSRQHQGWLITLEIFGAEIGAQVEGRLVALDGITAEWDEQEGSSIIIMARAKPDGHITHTISRPSEVSVEQTDEGADAALAIKAEDGTTALIRFRSAILPEMVDAVAP